MPRVPQLTRDKLSPQGQEAFDQIAGKRNRVSDLFAGLLNSPDSATRVYSLAKYARFEVKLTPQLRETIVLTTSNHFGSDFEWRRHVDYARELGVRAEAIEGIRNN